MATPLVVCVWLSLLIISCTALDPCTVRFRKDGGDGQFLGWVDHNVTFDTDSYSIASFLGIPFAVPPVDDRRFSRPEILELKNETVDATSHRSICYQRLDPQDRCQKDMVMSEDCLYLNIYVPFKTGTAAEKPPPGTTTTTGKTLSSTSAADTPPPSTAPTTASTTSSTTAPTTPSTTSTTTAQTTTTTPSTTAEPTTTTPSATTNQSASNGGSNPSRKRRDTSSLPVDLSETIQNQKLPVLIYIHGGGYIEGSGSCYNGSILAGFGDVIVVTINYRLGTFGFLSTEDDVIPGNLGLWDQQTAIKWVSEYIHMFGGDLDRITVGGQSAGSYSSLLQAMHALNDKLFKRVIAQSGTPLAKSSINTAGYETTLALARSLGCDIKGDQKRSQEIKSCLKGKNSSDIANAIPVQLTPSGLPLEPSLDRDFIESDPGAALLNGSMAHFARKDLLLGTIAQDGEVAFRLWALLQRYKYKSDSVLVEYLTRPINRSIFEHIVFEYLAEDLKEDIDSYKLAIETVLDKYVDWENPDDSLLLGNSLVAALTDVFFLLPSIDTAVGHSSPARSVASGNASGSASIDTDQGSTYLYRFSLPHKVRTFPSWQLPWFKGTAHAADIDYVFGQNLNKDEDVELSKFVMTAWSNFIKTGNPNYDNATSANQSLPVQWLPFTPSNQRHLNLSYTREMESSGFSGARHFWRELIPLVQQQLRARYQSGANSVVPRTCPSTKEGNAAGRRTADVIVLILNLALVLNVAIGRRLM